MNYENMSDHELLKQAGELGINDKHLNIEWRKRHSMNYPYRLNEYGIIVNMLLNAYVADRECDRLVLEQANKLRSESK